MNDDCALLIEEWSLAKKFDLPPESTVIVVGAYQGLAMEMLAELYAPKYLVGFEPQLWAIEAATRRLRGRANCMLIGAGLGLETGMFPMGEYHTDGCSFVNTGNGSRLQGSGQMYEAHQALSILGMPRVDLLIMNIEFYEFLLIPYLRKTGWLSKIDRLAVQWHLTMSADDPNANMAAEIEKLISEDSFTLSIDERPAWTYFTKP